MALQPEPQLQLGLGLSLSPARSAETGEAYTEVERGSFAIAQGEGSDLKPLFYHLEADAPQGEREIEVPFAGERAELRLKREFTSAKGFLALDNNLPSHLPIVCELIRGREELEAAALVPQALMAVPLRAARAGSVGLTLPGGEPVLVLVVVMVAERFSLWLSDVRFEVHAAEGELIRNRLKWQAGVGGIDASPQ